VEQRDLAAGNDGEWPDARAGTVRMTSAMESCVREFWWPIDRLGEAIETVAKDARLTRGKIVHALRITDDVSSGSWRALSTWIDWASNRLGVEAVEIETPVVDIEDMLATAGPAIVFHSTGRDRGFFVLTRRRGNRPKLLDREKRIRDCPVGGLRALLAAPFEAPLRPEFERLMEFAEVGPGRREGVARAMLRDRLATTQLRGAIMFRLPSGAPVLRQLSQLGTWRLLIPAFALFVLLYALEIGSWRLIGSGALEGRLDLGWLAAWAMILVTMVPARVTAGWLEARFALTVGRIMKARLLAGALALRPDVIKRSGVGQMIGRVIEAQALESLSLSGGVAIVTAIIELTVASWVLAHGAAPTLQLGLLAVFTATALSVGLVYYRRFRAWSLARTTMTNDLIEVMVGHRTRVVQDRPERREAYDDAMLDDYVSSSADMDRISVFAMSALPSAWIAAGLLALLPALGSETPPSPAMLAISVGGLLLGQRGFGAINGALASVARAAAAWGQIHMIFRAARDQPHDAPFVPDNLAGQRNSTPVIDGDGLRFAYDTGAKVIDDASIVIKCGDRILIEGPSGGGKSTLAALLTGLEQPEAGLLLLHGLDRATLGEAWHRFVTAAPQFHDNHILSESLAFNLLMGRAWPPSDDDLAAAKTLCEELALGDLIDRMPNGLHQRVGETGWQLSHGERSRIFLARALLQDASLTIMDESFAALDPETLTRCLETAMARAKTLVVVAHP
jgi:ATP-binding cassette, subfamily B, bacterial